VPPSQLDITHYFAGFIAVVPHQTGRMHRMQAHGTNQIGVHHSTHNSNLEGRICNWVSLSTEEDRRLLGLFSGLAAMGAYVVPLYPTFVLVDMPTVWTEKRSADLEKDSGTARRTVFE